MQKYLVEGRANGARLTLLRQPDILIDSNCINILDAHMSNRHYRCGRANLNEIRMTIYPAHLLQIT